METADKPEILLIATVSRGPDGRLKVDCTNATDEPVDIHAGTTALGPERAELRLMFTMQYRGRFLLDPATGDLITQPRTRH